MQQSSYSRLSASAINSKAKTTHVVYTVHHGCGGYFSNNYYYLSASAV